MKKSNRGTVRKKKGVKFTKIIEEDTKPRPVRELLKPSFDKIKDEMESLDLESGNFTFLPIRYSPPLTKYQRYEEFKSFIKSLKTSIHKKKLQEYFIKMHKNFCEDAPIEPDSYLKHFIRNYDVERVKQDRVMQSFTIGRKIIPKENTDRKINMEIHNSIMGVCMRKPKADNKNKAKKKSDIPHFASKNQVFGSADLQKRTDEYYSNFAKNTLQNDIDKKNRIKARKKNRDKNKTAPSSHYSQKTVTTSQRRSQKSVIERDKEKERQKYILHRMKKRGYFVGSNKRKPIKKLSVSNGETIRLLNEYANNKIRLFNLRRKLNKTRRRSIESMFHTHKILIDRELKKRSVFSPQTSLNDSQKLMLPHQNSPYHSRNRSSREIFKDMNSSTFTNPLYTQVLKQKYHPPSMHHSMLATTHFSNTASIHEYDECTHQKL
ncbi:unnamed protein product [Moneuplotes crassus]|uniref:Uncharacterized protein n=1 Tax=Euplotes crassus TaxID=5936 RepID=A0AAD1U7V0_EUPCR|nr:unnamed protein product [Moneuplotes crassus]